MTALQILRQALAAQKQERARWRYYETVHREFAVNTIAEPREFPFIGTGDECREWLELRAAEAFAESLAETNPDIRNGIGNLTSWRGDHQQEAKARIAKYSEDYSRDLQVIVEQVIGRWLTDDEKARCNSRLTMLGIEPHVSAAQDETQ